MQSSQMRMIITIQSQITDNNPDKQQRASISQDIHPGIQVVVVVVVVLINFMFFFKNSYCILAKIHFFHFTLFLKSVR